MFSLTYLVSLGTFGSPLEFKICGFEQYWEAHREFVRTKGLNHQHSDLTWREEKTPAMIEAVAKKKLARSVKIWGNVGRRSVCEVGEVKRRGGGARPRLWDLHLPPHPSRKGLPLRSSPLLPSQCLFSRAPLPYRMFGVGHWMLASCVLGGDWQQSEGQTPCRMQGGGGGGGGVAVLHKHIMWNSEAHSIVPCAISAVSCCELCLSYISAGAAFLILPHAGWSK